MLHVPETNALHENFQTALVKSSNLGAPFNHFAALAPSSEVCSTKFIAKIVFSGKVLATLTGRTWNNVNTYLVYNSPCDSHAIKDCNINNSWHASIIYGLRTIGPHVGTFSQVNIAWTQTTAGQRREDLKRKKINKQKKNVPLHGTMKKFQINHASHSFPSSNLTSQICPKIFFPSSLLFFVKFCEKIFTHKTGNFSVQGEGP